MVGAVVGRRRGRIDPAMSEWREQYERMKRWREAIAHDRIDPERVPDIFLAFAQTCYHMVDWLENDRSQPIRRRDAEDHVEGSAVLSFCRDICNGAKHARLAEKDVGLSTEVSVIGAITAISVTGERRRRETSIAELYVAFEGRRVLALDFADRCIAEWGRLLQSRGLL